MTSLSRSHTGRQPQCGAKALDSFTGMLAARNLLTGSIMMVSAGAVSWALGGCVPVPLGLDEADAAPNSPPILVSVTDEIGADLPSFKMVTLRRADATQKMIFTVADNDAADAVHVNYYVDYNFATATPRVGGCVAPPSVGGSERSVECATAPVCTQIADDEIHYLEAIVADRELDDADPSFRGLVAGGLSTIGRWWQVTCP